MGTAKKEKDEGAELKKKHPKAAAVVDQVVELLHAPHHISGTPKHAEDERELERLAKELEGLIPRAAHGDFIELMDAARLSLTPPRSRDGNRQVPSGRDTGRTEGAGVER